MANWTDDDKQRLRTMWAAGDPTKQIGAALRISATAAIRQAHRMKLTPRPSPIKRDGPRKTKAPPALKRGASTLAPLASHQ